MPKISELPALTTANNNDAIAIVETSTATTKRITRGDLLKSPLPANAVNEQAIAAKAVTADKIDFETLPFKKITDILEYDTGYQAGAAGNTYAWILNLPRPLGAGENVYVFVKGSQWSTAFITGQTNTNFTFDWLCLLTTNYMRAKFAFIYYKD